MEGVGKKNNIKLTDQVVIQYSLTQSNFPIRAKKGQQDDDIINNVQNFVTFILRKYLTQSCTMNISGRGT